uniref:Reverse transcriptase domain-containing protein n=1 Tax=Tanacetum cinerariifolium TaxID=118510 RepID=A0A6L2MH68_TANCI|nr:reverse transcriptase domain-containing protein [Tanacetum cinerariifolium]
MLHPGLTSKISVKNTMRTFCQSLWTRYHNQSERLQVRDRLRYNDRHVLDRLGHRRQSAFDRLSETYSPSTTKSRPDRTSPRDRSRNRSRPHRQDSSNGDCSQSRDCSHSIGESYDNSHSSYGTNHEYRYHDRDHSRRVKRGRDSESPLSRVSESGSSDRGHWKSKSKRHKPTDEDDLTMPWMCEEVDLFIPRIRNFKSSRGTLGNAYMFNSTLIGAARVWFDELPLERIDSYKDLKVALLAYFMQQKQYVKDPVEIHNIKQKDRETIEDFMEQFKVETERMKGSPECMRISGFMHEVNNPELTKRLNKHVQTMEEMMITTTALIRGEAAASSKKKGQPREERGSSMFTPLTRTPKEILVADTGKFQLPPPMIEELVRAAKLSHLIKEIKQGRDQSKVGKKEAPAKDKPMEIYMIQSWKRITRHKVTQSFERVREITFPSLATSSGTKGPLVIEVEIDGHMIHSCMWTEAPQRKLLVPIGDVDHSTRAWMNFMIVRSLSPYNGIIKRPGIKEIQAVPSTAYIMLKFPADEGIVTIRSTILIPAECAMVITSSKEIPKEAGVCHTSFKVALHPNFPDQEVAIRGTLSAKGRTEQCSLLKENLDIFAWQPSDMTGHDDGWKMCVDFTDLNKACPHDCYPIPEIDWKVESLCGYLFKCFLDAYKGYHQIQLAESDEEKMAFHTGQGVYCYTKMPFGLKNAGATYQRLVDKAFDSQIGWNIEVYIDKLVIKSHTEDAKRYRQESSELFPSVSCRGYYRTTHQINNVSSQRSKTITKMERHARRTQYHIPAKDVGERKDPSGFPRRNAGRKSARRISSRNSTRAVDTLHGWIFVASNNEAEYEELVAGLRIATQMEMQNVHVSVDSKLVENQVLGAYVTKEKNMIKYMDKVKGLERGKQTPDQGSTVRIIEGGSLQAVIPYAVAKWGIDIAGPFPEGTGKVKFLIVAMDYFMKWIEAKAVATITGNQNDVKMTKYYNARFRGVTFRPGDFVYRSNETSHAVDGRKLGPKWEGPYEVTEALGDGAYKLRSAEGTVLPRTWNVANLKKCYL